MDRCTGRPASGAVRTSSKADRLLDARRHPWIWRTHSLAQSSRTQDVHWLAASHIVMQSFALEPVTTMPPAPIFTRSVTV